MSPAPSKISDEDRARLKAKYEERRALHAPSKLDVLRQRYEASRAQAPQRSAAPPLAGQAISAQPAGQQQLHPNPPPYIPPPEISAAATVDPMVASIEEDVPGPMRRVMDTLRAPENQRLVVESATDIAGGALGNKWAALKGMRTLGTVGARSLGAGFGAGVGSLAMEAVDPSEDPYGRALVTAGLAGAGEGVVGGFIEGMRVLSKGGGSIGGGRFRPIKDVDNFYDDVSKHIDPVTRKPLRPTPGTGSEAYWVDFVENITSNSPGGAGAMKTARENVEAAMKRDVERFIWELGDTHGTKAVAVANKSALKGNTDLWKIKGKTLFDGVDEAAAGIQIDLKAVGELAEEINERSVRGVASPAEEKFAKSVIKHLKKGDDDVVNTLVNFRTAQDLRSDFIAANIGLEDPVKSRAEASAARLAQETHNAIMEALADPIDTAIDKAGANLTGEARKRFRNANRFWKAGSARYNNEIISVVSRNRSQAFMRSAIPDGNQWETVRMARKAVGKDAWKDAQGEYLNHVFKQSKGSGKEILEHIKLTLGDESWKELIPEPSKRKLFERFARNLEISQAPTSHGVGGSFLAQMTAAGAILTLVGVPVGFATGDAKAGAGAGAAALILLSPPILARVGMSPAFNRWLQVGMKAKPGSTSARRAWTAMSVIAAREQSRYDERTKKAEIEKVRDKQRVEFDKFNQRHKELTGAARTSMP